jgi:ribonuclease PH
MRPVSLERNVARFAEGSCLVKFGLTQALWTAPLEDKPPMWLRGQERYRREPHPPASHRKDHAMLRAKAP